MAIRVGISLREYDEITPHELNLYIEEYNLRKQEESEIRLVQAYLGAYWQRVKKMPSLQSVLKDMKPRKTQTDEQMLAQIKAINAAMGGNVKEGG